MNNNIKTLSNGDFIVEPLTEVGKWMDEDKDYKESTLEKQAEFAKKRNYVYQEIDMNVIMIDALKELNLKVEALRARVEQMEKCPWDEWKASKDIV